MKRIKIVLVICCLLILLSGCMTTGPVNNADFGKVEKISDLEGIYRNHGEGGNGVSTIYLSSIIWPSIKELDHKAIETIEVRTVNNNTLIVKALGESGVIKEEQFIEGKDFVITSGRINLKKDVLISLAYPGDNPFIGAGYGETELGIDERGHGKYRQKSSFAGTAFLIIPLVGSGTDDVRFVKVDK